MVCWRLALRLAAVYREDLAAGWRQLAAWCGRCTPPYPEREAREVWKWHLVQVSDAVEAGEPVPFRVVASFRFDPALGCETRLWARCVADGVSAGGSGVPCRVMSDNQETGQ